jgi:hypothetical protein
MVRPTRIALEFQLWREWGVQGRQAHHELGSTAHALASRLDGSTVHLDDSLREREANAQAELRILRGCINLPKHLEESREVFRRDAYARVFH